MLKALVTLTNGQMPSANLQLHRMCMYLKQSLADAKSIENLILAIAPNRPKFVNSVTSQSGQDNSSSQGEKQGGGLGEHPPINVKCAKRQNVTFPVKQKIVVIAQNLTPSLLMKPTYPVPYVCSISHPRPRHVMMQCSQDKVVRE